jgi:hypothetical protein
LRLTFLGISPSLQPINRNEIRRKIRKINNLLAKTFFQRIKR